LTVEIKLSKRLSAIAEFVGPGTVADIGCDHGLLACALAQRGHLVYAVDKSKNALERTRRLAAEMNIENILPLHGEGLAPVPCCPDNVVVAGLGAGTTLGILHDGLNKLNNARIILCPASRPEKLCQGLRAMDFTLRGQTLILENTRYCAVLFAIAPNYATRR